MLGLAWVPLAKRLTALSKLQKAIDGALRIDEYHSLLGLLEHLVFLQGRRRRIMYHMWAPFKQGIALEPNRLLSPSPQIVRQCKAWIHLLSKSSAVSALRMLSRIPPSVSTLVITIYSDAAVSKGPCSESGMGGWCHGQAWAVDLRGESPWAMRCRALPIAALEFIATAVSLFTFAALLPEAHRQTRNCLIHLRADALATPLILTEDAASSPLMVELHSCLLASDEYLQLAELAVISHVYGVGNEFSDAVSRSDRSRLRALASQLRTSITDVSPHSIVHTLLSRAVSVHESHRHTSHDHDCDCN